MDIRLQKGEQIAQTRYITRKAEDAWIVPSQSGNGAYTVSKKGSDLLCTCPDYEKRRQPCKHVYAVQITVLQWFDINGKKVAEIKRVTYPQNWSAYNKAQTNEQDLFMKLLADLCDNIEEPLYRFGRPQLSLKGMVFGSALKVYSTFSLRRFISDMRTAKEKGYVDAVCSYSSVSNYMRDKNLTPILQSLITLSAMPLRSVETKFAIDSTGFRTTKFNDYCREKHNTGKQHQWLKAHICTGVKTNIVTGVQVTNEHGADSPEFIPLAYKTAKSGFTVDEISADKAYLSRENLAYVDQLGGVPYIPFKSNITGRHGREARQLWARMYNYFIFYRQDFLEHYHLRSNVESTNNMIKAKFTDLVRSKDSTAQVNEVLLKILCHNLVVIIQEMHELGIEPNFIE